MATLFKPIGAVLCLVFALCFAAPNAQADTLFVYTVEFFDSIAGFSFTTVPVPLTDLGVVLPTSDLSASSLTGSAFAGCALSSVTLNAFNIGATGLSFTGCGMNTMVIGDGFTLAQYSTPGKYVGTVDTMTVTAVQTPEPSSVALMLAGVGLVFAMPKRWMML
jgi:hypothetical protein